MQYALIVVAIEMNKFRDQELAKKGNRYYPYVNKYAFIRYHSISDKYIYVDKVIGHTNDVKSIDEIEGRGWAKKHDTLLYEFEDDEEALLWYKLNY